MARLHGPLRESAGVRVASQDRSVRGYIDGQEPCLVGEAAAPEETGGGGRGVDPNEIFASVGEVVYEWRLDSDAIAWGSNAGDVLAIRDPAAIATGQGYAALIDPKSGRSRHDAVARATARDEGPGVPYQLQYALRAPRGAEPCWVEDTGRWFAGADGKPARAHGIVRVINDRHEREQRLAYL